VDVPCQDVPTESTPLVPDHVQTVPGHIETVPDSVPILDLAGISAPTVTEPEPVVSSSVEPIPPPTRPQRIRRAPRYLKDYEH
jgi:hypothetical protein